MRKRSHRIQRALINPLTRMRPATKEKRDRVLLSFHTALESIAVGKHPGEEEWRALSDAINTVETLVNMGKLVDHEIMPVVCAAIEGMVGAARRFRAGQGMRLDGAGMKAIREVVDIYEQCLDGFTEAEMAQAQHETQMRLEAIWRSKSRQANVTYV